MRAIAQPEPHARIRKPGDGHHGSTSTFDLDALLAEPFESGASNAVLSAWEDLDVSEMTFADHTDEMPELAAEEQLGFGGKFSRFFSRRVDFQINGTRVVGKNGFQVRGRTVSLGTGAALDLMPATLTGRREGRRSSAEGRDAQLYLATGGNVTRQPLDHVYMDSDQNLHAEGTAPASVTLPTHELTLGPVQITQNQGAPEIQFDSATLKGGTVGKGYAVGVALLDGKLFMDHLDLPHCRTRLYGLTLTEKELRFTRGEVAWAETNVSLESGVVDDALPGRLAAKMVAEKTPAVKTVGTATQGLLAGARDGAVPPQPKKTAADNLLLLSLLSYDPEKQAGTADFTLSASLLTQGEYGLDFGTVTAGTVGTKFTLNDEGLINAKLHDLELTVKKKDKELESYRVVLIEAALTADVFSAKAVQVEKIKQDSKLESKVDGDGSLAQLLTFSIPKMPHRVAFSTLVTTGHLLEAKDSTVMAGAYQVEGLGDLFSAELDMANRSFAVSLTAKSDLAEKGFFSKGGIPLAEVPILPGLTFGLSLQPEANMSGTFGVAGAFPESAEKPWFLKGKGKFEVGVSVELAADLELGAGSIAGLYVGLTGKAGLDTTIELGVAVNMKHDNGKLSAESLGIDGSLESALKGSIGAHAGFKLLFWDAQLFSYTFKEWEILNMLLSLAISKDMQQSFTKGWNLEDSSFTVTSFGKLLTKDKMRFQADKETMLEAIQLEGDYEKLKEHLQTVVAGYQKLQAELVGTEGKGLLLSVETVQAQSEALLSLGKQLEEHAEAAKVQDETLHTNFVLLADELTKQRSRTEGARQKHGDRKQLLTNAEKLVLGEKKLNYDQALAAAEEPTRAEIRRQELRKLGIPSYLLAHEKEQLKYYKAELNAEPNSNKYQAGVRKHEARIQRLENARTADGKLDDDILLLLKETATDHLRDKLDSAANARMGELNSMKGFYNATHQTEEDFEKKSDMDRISARLKYETTRYSHYDSQTLHREMDLVLERLLRMKEIQEESKKISSALAPLAGLKGGEQGATGEVFQNLQVLLQAGVNLDKTAEKFDYVEAAQSSRDTQRAYLKAVQEEIRQGGIK